MLCSNVHSTKKVGGGNCYSTINCNESGNTGLTKGWTRGCELDSFPVLPFCLQNEVSACSLDSEDLKVWMN